MSDFPDPDEEYELMYAEELEMMREQQDDSGKYVFWSIVYSKQVLTQILYHLLFLKSVHKSPYILRTAKLKLSTYITAKPLDSVFNFQIQTLPDQKLYPPNEA